MIRLVIADDHPLVLDGLERLFHDSPEFDVVARCTDGDQVLAAVALHEPDVLVLDLRMPRKDGLTVLREMRKKRPELRTIVLTAALNEEEVLESIRLGVKGVVLKEMPPRLLLDCVRKVHAGGQWIETNSMSRALERLVKNGSEPAGAARDSLTPRELEIVRMVTSGLRNKEIADRLAITEGTVKVHLHTVYQKLQVDGRMELMIFAQRHGIA
jgi:DNA-binding NarL/FixJ family response regulator